MSPVTTTAYIEPEVLRWARESAGHSLRSAADAMNVDRWYLEGVEEGKDYLSLREAERAAEVFGRSLAALFVPTPPVEDGQGVQFRRLPGAPPPPWGPSIQLTARAIRKRQEAALEIYDVLEEQPPWEVASRRFSGVADERLAEHARKVMGITVGEQLSWNHSDEYSSFRGWRQAIEHAGVLVMQDGAVEVEEMRGFASVEPSSVPAILVNNHDFPRARTFTLIHEFGHVIRASLGRETGPATELWCEGFAGEVLMPGAEFVEALSDPIANSTVDRVRQTARRFGVTPSAAAVRAGHIGVLSAREVSQVLALTRSRRSIDDDEEPAGGNFYKNQVAKFGPAYLRLVFSALDTEAVTLPAATGLLGGAVKAKRFDRLRSELGDR